MRISFALPFTSITGGIRAVFELGNQLSMRGHEIRFVYPKVSILSRRNTVLISAGRLIGRTPPLSCLRTNSGFSGWMPLCAPVVEVPDTAPSAFPESDFVVATSWQTARWVNELPPKAGKKAYFLQHYEVWSGARRSVDATWRFPMVRIGSSAWLSELGRARFGITDMHIVPYGVNHEMFYPGPFKQRASRCLRVGVLHHQSQWKGFKDAMRVFRKATKGLDVRLALFGLCAPPRNLDFGFEYYWNPVQQLIRDLYCSLDIFLCSSWTETGPMPVVEAMACGVPAVTTDVGNVRLWSNDGQLALLSQPHDIDHQVENLRSLLLDPQSRARLSSEGAAFVKRFTWGEAARQFEGALLA